jgi:hypothetical protein
MTCTICSNTLRRDVTHPANKNVSMNAVAVVAAQATSPRLLLCGIWFSLASLLQQRQATAQSHHPECLARPSLHAHFGETCPCGCAPCCSFPVSYAATFLTVISAGVDGVFTAADPWPFVGLHYLQVCVGVGLGKLFWYDTSHPLLVSAWLCTSRAGSAVQSGCLLAINSNRCCTASQNIP